MRAPLALPALALMLVLAPCVAAQREPPVPKELLDRVSDWTERFLAGFQNCEAEETLTQIKFGKKGQPEAQRRIVSDYAALRLLANLRELVEVRDVVAVDEREVRSAEQRDARRAKLAQARTKQEVFALVEDPAKYRLSATYFGGLSLLVTRLAERQRERVKFFFAQDTSDPPSPHVLVGYRQFTGEALLDVDGAPVYPSGQAWVDPNEGAIIRIEEEFQHKTTRYSTAVEFARNADLGAWLPQQITVRIFEKGHLEIESVYSYRNYRRLETSASTASPAPQTKN